MTMTTTSVTFAGISASTGFAPTCPRNIRVGDQLGQSRRSHHSRQGHGRRESEGEPEDDHISQDPGSNEN